MAQGIKEATAGDILALVEELAPFELSDEYVKRYGGKDNSGLLIGSPSKRVFRVLVTLDITGEVVTEAVDLSADVIIVHHPLMYRPISAILEDEVNGAVIAELIRADITVIAAHLNLDAAPFGINQVLADMLELEDACAILPVGKDGGVGRIGKLYAPCTAGELTERCRELFPDGNLRFSGRDDQAVSKVAVVGGGAGNDMPLLSEAIRMGADFIITGDISHYMALWLSEQGIAFVDAGHHATEAAALPDLCDTLRRYAETEGLDVEIALSNVDTNPFRIR